MNIQINNIHSTNSLSVIKVLSRIKKYDVVVIGSDIYEKGETMEMNGDQTLGKELSFSVFCRRWGHADSYRMQRTIDGWNVRHCYFTVVCCGLCVCCGSEPSEIIRV